MNNSEGMYRVTRYVWYVFYVIEALLALRLILKLLGANPGAAFTDLVYGASGVFVAPFRYVFSAPAAGGSVLELSTILALVVYWLIAWGIVKFVVMNRTVSPYEAQESLEEQDRA